MFLICLSRSRWVKGILFLVFTLCFIVFWIEENHLRFLSKNILLLSWDGKLNVEKISVRRDQQLGKGVVFMGDVSETNQGNFSLRLDEERAFEEPPGKEEWDSIPYRDFPSDWLSTGPLLTRPNPKDALWPGDVPFVALEIEKYCQCFDGARVLFAGDSMIRNLFTAAIEYLNNDRSYCDDTSNIKKYGSKCSGDAKYWHDVRTLDQRGNDRERCPETLKLKNSPCDSVSVSVCSSGRFFFQWAPNKKFNDNLKNETKRLAVEFGKFDFIVAGMGFHELQRVVKQKMPKSPGTCNPKSSGRIPKNCKVRKIPGLFGWSYKRFVRVFWDEVVPENTRLIGERDGRGAWLSMHSRTIPLVPDMWKTHSNAFVLWLNKIALDATKEAKGGGHRIYIDQFHLTLEDPFRSYSGDGVHFLRIVYLHAMRAVAESMCPSLELPSRFEDKNVRLERHP